MGQNYSQLGLNERGIIDQMRSGGHSLDEIAEALERSKSTISRELKRNSKATKQWPGGYDAVRADALATRRRCWDCRFKLARQPELRAHVLESLAAPVLANAGRTFPRTDSRPTGAGAIYHADQP